MEEKTTQSIIYKEVTECHDRLVSIDVPENNPSTSPQVPPDSGKKLTEQASEIVSDILKAAHRIRGILNSYYAEYGLTDIRFSVLQIIKKSDLQGCTQSELAEQLQQSESSISTLVDRMRNSDLIYRLRSKSDRRKRVLVLTDQGRVILDQVEKCHNEHMDKLLKPFRADQKEELASLLSELVNHLTFRNGHVSESLEEISTPSSESEIKPSAA